MSEEDHAHPGAEAVAKHEALMQEHDEAVLALLMITQHKASMEKRKTRLEKMVARYGGFMDEDAGRETEHLTQAVDALSRELDHVKETRSRTSRLMAELVYSNRPPTVAAAAASDESDHAIIEAFRAEVDRRFRKYDEALEQERDKSRQLERRLQELYSNHESLQLDVKKQESTVEDSRKGQEENSSALQSFMHAIKQSLEHDKAASTSLQSNLEKTQSNLEKLLLGATKLSEDQEKLRSDSMSEKTSVDERLQQIDQQLTQMSSKIDKRVISGQTVLHPPANGLNTNTSLDEIHRRLTNCEQTLSYLRDKTNGTSLKEGARLILQNCMKLFERHELVIKLQDAIRAAEGKMAEHDKSINSMKQELHEFASEARQKYKESETFVAEVEEVLKHTAGELAQFRVGVMARNGELPPLKTQLPDSSKTSAVNTPVLATRPAGLSSRLGLGKGLFEGPPKPAKRPRAE